MSDRDQILATFQSVSGENDVEKCLAVLESMDWKLMEALGIFMADQEVENTAPNLEENEQSELNPVADHETGQDSLNNSPTEIPSSPQEPLVMNEEMGAASSSFGLESPDFGNSKIRLINFDVHYNNKKYPLSMMDEHTVGHMKECLKNSLDVSVSRMKLHFAKRARVPDSTCIRDLHLPKENAITLSICPHDGDNKDKTDDRSSPGSHSTAKHQKTENKFKLHVKETFGRGRTHVITETGNTTVRQFRIDVANVTGVPPSQQIWVGWPPYPKTNYDMKLEDSGIDFIHYFELDRDKTSAKGASTSTSVGVTERQSDSKNQKHDKDSDDDEDEDDFDMYSDDDTMDMVSADKTNSQMRSLIPDSIEDEKEGVETFVEVFKERYAKEAERIPNFFIDTLENAVKAATNGDCFKRRPLALYLHDDKSVLSNIFCTQVLCSQPIADYFNENDFVLWPWDLSNSLSCSRFYTRLTRELGSMAVIQIQSSSFDQLPAIIFVNKARGALEATSIILGNVCRNEVLTSLLSAFELYSVQLEEEKKAENERVLRRQVREEQDEAYLHSLRQDEEKERKRVEEEKRLEEEQQKTKLEQMEVENEEMAEKSAAESRLPPEPEDDINPNDVIIIRLRLPSTTQSQCPRRKFFTHHRCQHVFDYTCSLGYPTHKYKLITTYPRIDITTLESSKTLKELGLSQQETLIVEQR